MFKSNQSMLISVTTADDSTEYRVVDYVAGVESIKTWSTNLFRGKLANTTNGYTTVNDKAPLSLLRDISDLIKW